MTETCFNLSKAASLQSPKYINSVYFCKEMFAKLDICIKKYRLLQMFVF